MHNHVVGVMTGKVEDRLNKWYSDTSLDYDIIGTWCSDGTLDVSKNPLVQSSYLSNAKQQLQITLGLSASRTFLSSDALFKRGYGCFS